MLAIIVDHRVCWQENEPLAAAPSSGARRGSQVQMTPSISTTVVLIVRLIVCGSRVRDWLSGHTPVERGPPSFPPSQAAEDLAEKSVKDFAARVKQEAQRTARDRLSSDEGGKD